ncbi:CysS/YqeB C-terminal domain-containing protein [Planomonospora algeriensis]
MRAAPAPGRPAPRGRGSRRAPRDRLRGFRRAPRRGYRADRRGSRLGRAFRPGVRALPRGGVPRGRDGAEPASARALAPRERGGRPARRDGRRLRGPPPGRRGRPAELPRGDRPAGGGRPGGGPAAGPQRAAALRGRRREPRGGGVPRGRGRGGPRPAGRTAGAAGAPLPRAGGPHLGRPARRRPGAAAPAGPCRGVVGVPQPADARRAGRPDRGRLRRRPRHAAGAAAAGRDGDRRVARPGLAVRGLPPPGPGPRPGSAAGRRPAPTLPPGAAELLERRRAAREAGDQAACDLLARELAALGVEVADTPQGQSWTVR